MDIGRADEYTVAAWLRTWFELYSKLHIRPSTMNYYHRNIEQHIIPAIGDIPLNKLTTRDLQKFYNDLQSNGRLRKVQKKEKPGLSNSTVRGIHMMLHNALDRAVKEKLILSNPTENCIIPKIEKQEMKILHPDHISAYLNAAERRNALPMFYLELVSGLRKGELVALQWSDLDEANCTISVSKQASWDTEHQLILSRPKTGNSIREVSIPQDAVELLKQEHAKHPSNPWMFPSGRTGEMYHPDSVVTLHKRILKDAGLEHIRFHDLRHTFATLALQNGVDVKTVFSMLGHYDAGFTFAPTPSHGRCSKRPQRKWAASWRRFDKSRRQAEHRKGNNFSGALWFFPRISLYPWGELAVGGKAANDWMGPKSRVHFSWVTVWVRQLTHFDPHHFQRFATKSTENRSFRCFWSWWCDSNT